MCLAKVSRKMAKIRRLFLGSENDIIHTRKNKKINIMFRNIRSVLGHFPLEFTFFWRETSKPTAMEVTIRGGVCVSLSVGGVYVCGILLGLI